MVLGHDTTQGTRTQDIHISQDVTFDTMLLSTETLKGLQSGGFHRPSPVQLHGIPLGKCGFDMLLEAKSGTGKTAVFTIIALEKIDLSKGLQVVILAPTREIAAQICDVIKVIGSSYTGLCVEVVMGGLPVVEDIEKFKSKKRVHIVVGSPGRLRHLVHDGHIDTSAVRMLVLDEADQLMGKSFQADINYIYSALPKQKQVMMSSATYPEETKAFISQYVKNSQHVCPDSTSVLLGIEQKVTTVNYSSNVVIQTQNKYKELLKILSQKPFKQCLIFCNYQARISKLDNMLTRDKWPSEQLYGQLDQTDRLDALKTLQEYKCRILIATDLAARGIDASNVDLVINFEPPYEWQTYLHRIGRAGRYGSYGLAVTILSEGAEELKFKKILSPMKGSLKICNLWDGSNLFSDDGNASNGIESSKAKQYPDFWKEITAVSNEVIEIKSFADLNHSFNDSSLTKVESFSELLQSFESSSLEEESQDITYVNIKVDKTSAKECLNYFQSKIKASHDELNSNPSLKCEDPNRDDNHNTHRSNNIEHIVNSCPNVTSKEEITTCDESRVIESSKNKAGLKREDSVGDDEAINSDSDYGLNRDMALLGLPTAFGRPKVDKKKSRHKMSVFQEENNNYTIHSHQNNMNKDSTNMQSSNGCKTKKPINKTINSQEYVDDAPGSHKSGCVVNTSAKARSIRNSNQRECKEHEHRRKVYTKKSAHINHKYEYESNSSSDEEIPSHSSSVNLSYINWYKQLKMRTKQLELAFYIEEMSKM